MGPVSRSRMVVVETVELCVLETGGAELLASVMQEEAAAKESAQAARKQLIRKARTAKQRAARARKRTGKGA